MQRNGAFMLRSIHTCDFLNYCVKTGRSQNTVPIASTQVAIKGIVQYSMDTHRHTLTDTHIEQQSATRHSREHTLSAVGPDVHVE